MDEHTCETCGHGNVSMGAEPCCKCPCSYTSQWVPMPAKPEAGGVTLAELDALLRLQPALGILDDLTCSLRALRPLVEEAECKRLIDSAGCVWSNGSNGRISVTASGTPWKDMPTWPESVAWAEAQAAKRERWSEPVSEMDAERANTVLRRTGYPGSTYILQGDREATYNLGQMLRAWGYGRGIYRAEDDTILLPPEAP
jgi:hypothetical protein